jgi:hypothetical protein
MAVGLVHIAIIQIAIVQFDDRLGASAIRRESLAANRLIHSFFMGIRGNSLSIRSRPINGHRMIVGNRMIAANSGN